MYSVVMMMAMTGAVDLPERGKCCDCSCSCSCRGKRCRGCRGCHGCCSCYGCHGCCGGIVVVVPAKKKMTSGDAPAIIRVSLPADATLTVDGTRTTSTSAQRVFVSPPLAENQEFVYTLRAEVVREGRSLAETQRVTVRGGQETNVPFRFSSSAVASSR